jgi:DNA invertase Pin-like site-specific DNA recombinase
LILPAAPSAADTIGYVRVSSEDQATDRKTSLGDQRAAIDALAGRLGRQLGQVFADPGASGASAEGRPGFMQLVAFCRTNARSPRTPGYVLVLNDSRWGRFRDPEEAGYWRVELRRHGWLVRFAENDSIDSPARPLERAMFQWTSTAYRDAIVANAKRGVRGTTAQGFWANEAPIGYRRQVVAGGPTRTFEPGQRKAPNERVRLVPGPANEVALIQDLFTRYAAGTVSLGHLVRELKGPKYPAIPPRRWAVQSLARLLKNETYLGHVIWCRRPHDALEREATPVRPADQWVVTRDAHPALVSQDLFDQVQARLALNRRQLRKTVGGYALTGLLSCTCGRPYIGGGGPKGPAADPDRYRFYRCSGQKDTGRSCSAPSGILPRRLVEPAIVQVIGDVVADPAVTGVIAEELDRQLASVADARSGARAQLERRRGELEAQHRRVIDGIALGAIDAEETRPTIERIRKERADVAAALDRTRFEQRQAVAIGAERDRLLAIARDFPGLAARLHGLALRELLRPWLAGAVVDLGAREVRLTIRRIPGAASFILSSPQRGPDLR